MTVIKIWLSLVVLLAVILLVIHLISSLRFTRPTRSERAEARRAESGPTQIQMAREPNPRAIDCEIRGKSVYVSECPFCGGKHYHSMSELHLRTVRAQCGGGFYYFGARAVRSTPSPAR